MADSLAASLPPLRRKILKSFFLVVALYGLLGLLITVGLYLASGVTPKLIHVNYDSIAAAREMRIAWQVLRHPEENSPAQLASAVKRFEAALTFEESNVTEPGEGDAASEIRKTWDKAKRSPETISLKENLSTHRNLTNYLDRLVVINEQAMFRLAEDAIAFRNRIFSAALLIFLFTLAFALYLADSLANRVSRPIKDIAEALRNKPIPGEKLKLPVPTSLEIRILTHEMTQLWKRLSELRKLNVEEIATQRSKLEALVDAVEDGIIVIDNPGNVIQCNEGLLKIIGLPVELVVGQKWNDLPSSNEQYLKLRESLVNEDGNEKQIDLQVGGRARFFMMRSRVISNKEGEVLATVYLLHDVTERKERERLKSEFIAVLSHELKTPLQSLSTASDLLMKRMEGKTEDEAMLFETIHEDVARIRAVADDFMQVTFVDPHSLRLKIHRHPLNELIREWVKPFKVVAQDKKVTLEVDFATPEIIWAAIDSVKFPWAISNLLSNAIRFSPPESRVTVSVAKSDHEILIEIKDEGPGIPEEVRKKMFDPYYQSTSGEASIPSGFLGLGLTIAKEVVEAHQGTISYVVAQPRGSIFRIGLPLPEVDATKEAFL